MSSAVVGVVASVGVALTPAVLFVLFWRLLVRLRDGLAERVCNELGIGCVGPNVLSARVPADASDHVAGASTSTVACRHCGASNERRFRYCRRCLQRLR
jgi:hypothetical protein